MIRAILVQRTAAFESDQASILLRVAFAEENATVFVRADGQSTEVVSYLNRSTREIDPCVQCSEQNRHTEH